MEGTRSQVKMSSALPVDMINSILKSEKEKLTQEGLIPFDSFLQRDLCKNVEITKAIKKQFTEAAKKSVLPMINTKNVDNLSMFLGEIINSNHPLGSEIMRLTDNFQSEIDFISQIQKISQELRSFCNTRLMFQQHLTFDLRKLEILFSSKLEIWTLESFVPSLFFSIFQICSFLDENLVHNQPDFYPLLER